MILSSFHVQSALGSKKTACYKLREVMRNSQDSLLIAIFYFVTKLLSRSDRSPPPNRRGWGYEEQAPRARALVGPRTNAHFDLRAL